MRLPILILISSLLLVAFTDSEVINADQPIRRVFLWRYDELVVLRTRASTVKQLFYQEGIDYKQITGAEQFDSYEEAEAYLSSQESANYEIVGNNPFVSPVPLEALEHYRLIHGSDSSIELPEIGTIPAVKIFEYID